MSHHFAPEFTVVPPGKEPVSKKLQRSNELTSSAKRRETQQLDFDNKQMEWKLNQLKQAMSKEKEDRGKQGYIWKSGVSGKLDSHARNILGRSVSATVGSGNAQRTKKSPTGSKSAPKSKQKVKILRDEPLDLPQRSSRAKDLIQKLKSEMPPSELPQNSGDFENRRQQEDWILIAFDKNSNESMEVQSDMDGNLPLSCIQAIDPSAIGIYFVKWGRKRLLMAVDGVVRRPKAGWGDDVYFPYVGRSLPAEMVLKPEPPLRNLSNNDNNNNNTVAQYEPSPRRSGGALLEGNFDEGKNAESFQQALDEWRSNKKENNDNSAQQNGHTFPEMSVHVAQCTSAAYEVKFSETSTLTYMEHILLNKHRSSEVPPMPKSLIDTLNDCLDEKNENEDMLTADEIDERQRYRQLFTPDVPESMTSDTNTVIIDEVIDDVITETTDNCIVEESPPESPQPNSNRTESSVVIEEMHFDIQNTQPEVTPDIVKNTVRTIRKERNSEVHQEKNKTPRIQVKLPKQNGTPRQSKSARLHHGTPRKNSSDENRSKTSLGRYSDKFNKKDKTVPKTFSLIHEIGKIPINPDAIYHEGLKDFFSTNTQNTDDDNNLVETTKEIRKAPEHSTFATASSVWNPVSSIYSPDLSTSVYSDIDDEKISESRQSNVMREDIQNTGEEDEKALDDLEWELASRTGNITSDGRISRLIDEWSNEGNDLDIIDDPGLGSGLSTPDVDRNSLSVATTRYQDDVQLEHDFQNIEQMIMADISDEYSDGEL